MVISMFRQVKRVSTAVGFTLSRFSFLNRSRLFTTGPFQTMAQLINKGCAQEIIQNVDNFLFDCDGVLWNAQGAIEGSVDTVKKLKALGKRVFYVTNNSTSTRLKYVEKCERLGFPAEETDIVCTAYVAAEYLKNMDFKGKVYLVGLEDSIGKELTNAGISYFGPGPDPIQSIIPADWRDNIDLDPEVTCVLVGFDPYISYPKMLKAASYLKNPDCLFVVTNEDGCLPDSRICIPGTGSISSPIKLASEREPTVLGKPEVKMLDVLNKVHSLDVSRTMMFGDRYDTDIVFAEKCGMKCNFLVLTGVTAKSDLDSGKVKATYYAPCLGDLGKLI